MSVVDQRVGLAAGRVRRLLVRVLLVLGGVCVATVVGWLFSAGSANAASLPDVPRVPSVLSATADQVSTSDLVTSVRPVLSTAVPQALPATPSLDGVAKQVHVAVSSVGDRVTPSVAPATALVRTTGLASVVPATATEHVASHVTPAAPPVRPAASAASAVARSRSAAAPRHWHAVGRAPVQLPGAHRIVPVPAPTDRGHVPPLPPASSSDSGAHSAGGVAGGASGAQVPVPHVFGSGPHLAGVPNTPRPAVAPGQQPGTSPD